MTTAPELHLTPVVPTGADEAVGDDEPLDFDAAAARALPKLRRYAARRLLDEHDAEEVAQEALLRAYQHRDRLRTEDDLMAWATVVTSRLVIDRVRVRGRTTAVAELPAHVRTARDTADVVLAREEARLALHALEAMPTRQAAVLWAREVEGLSYDAIGGRYGMTEAGVRSVLHRARKSLRKEYAVRGGGLAGFAATAAGSWVAAAARIPGSVRRALGAGGSAATALATAGALTATVGGVLAPQLTAPVHRPPAHVAPAVAPPTAAARGAAGLPTAPGVDAPGGLTLPSAPAVPVPAAPVTPPPVSAPTPPPPPPITKACVTVTTSQPVASCATARTDASLSVDAPVPFDPLGADHLAVGGTGVDCVAGLRVGLLPCLGTAPDPAGS